MSIPSYQCSMCGLTKKSTRFGQNTKQERSKHCKLCVKVRNTYNADKIKREQDYNKTPVVFDENEWKRHPTHTNYLSNRHGVTINTKTNRLIGAIYGLGYVKVGSKIDQHRLIYETFNGLIPPSMVINHINEVKHDNRLSNLECVTQSYNMKHATKKITGTLTRRPVRAHDIETEQDTDYKSITMASKETGCLPSNISFCAKGIINTTTSTTTNHRYSFSFV